MAVGNSSIDRGDVVKPVQAGIIVAEVTEAVMAVAADTANETSMVVLLFPDSVKREDVVVMDVVEVAVNVSVMAAISNV